MSRRKYFVKLPISNMPMARQEEHVREVRQVVRDFMPEADWLVTSDAVEIYDLTDDDSDADETDNNPEAESEPRHYFIRDEIVTRLKSKLYGLNPFTGGRLFTPYNHQYTILDKIASSDKNFFAIMSGRQMGLSTIVKNYASMAALLNPECNILVTANTLNSVDSLRKDIAMILPELLRDLTDNKIEMTVSSKREIKLSNGSSIYFSSLNENTARGLALDYVFVDNAAYSRTDLEDLWASIHPALPPHCTAIFTSTANAGSSTFNKMAIGHPKYVNIWEGIYMTWSMASEIDDGRWNGEEKVKQMRALYSKDTFEGSFNLNNNAHCFNEFE